MSMQLSMRGEVFVGLGEEKGEGVFAGVLQIIEVGISIEQSFAGLGESEIPREAKEGVTRRDTQLRSKALESGNNPLLSSIKKKFKSSPAVIYSEQVFLKFPKLL